MSRIAALSDVHGNAAALEAVLADIAREKPDALMVAGDLVLNGPEPALVIDVLRSLAGDGALIIGGNTDIAVADFDYAAAFPWMIDGVPDAIVDAAEWAHEAIGDERLDWLRRLPAERRDRFMRQITDTAAADTPALTLDYWRLNILARKGDD